MVEVGAIRLDRVDVVLLGVTHLDVVEDEAVGSVGPDADVLDGSDRRPVAGGGVAGVDRHRVGRSARALDLKVAADAWPRIRDHVPVDTGWLRHRRVRQRPSQDRDQVLIVRALDLVCVGDRARLALVVGDLQAGARRIVGRLRPRLRLGVEAGQDLDPVVVVGGGDRGLDRGVAAVPEQLDVEAAELLGLLLLDLDGRLRLAELVALLPGLLQVLVQGLDRLVLGELLDGAVLLQPLARHLLADDPRLAGLLLVEGAEDLADGGDRSTCRRLDRRVGSPGRASRRRARRAQARRPERARRRRRLRSQSPRSHDDVLPSWLASALSCARI